MFGEPPQTVDNLIERAAAAKLCGGRAVVSRHSRLAAAVHVVHAFLNAFALREQGVPAACTDPWPSAESQVAALRFTKRSQFCMHSNKMPFRLRSASLAECPVATDADRISWRIRSMVYPTMVAQIRPLRRYGPSIGLWTD